MNPAIIHTDTGLIHLCLDDESHIRGPYEKHRSDVSVGLLAVLGTKTLLTSEWAREAKVTSRVLAGFALYWERKGLIKRCGKRRGTSGRKSYLWRAAN